MILNLKSQLVSLFVIVLFQLVTFNRVEAQLTDIKSLPKSHLIQDAESLAKQNASTATLIRFIKSYNQYPKLENYRGQHIFFIKDSVFGNIPFKFFLPQNYNPTNPSTLILSLHGAVGISKFENAANSNNDIDKDDDPFYSSLCKQNFIVIKPFADPAKGFNWAANKFGSDVNYTFNALSHLIKSIKQVVNVDDNKVFVFGHSDGSDGTFGFGVYQPSIFAGFVLYNSMFNLLFTNNIFVKNVINRPQYEAHSDKDDLRPIEQNRVIINLLDSLGANITYKEYKGYTHEDKHLQIDFPNSLKFIDSTIRNPYHHKIYWETNDVLNKQCDWLIINDWKLENEPAEWHKVYNVKAYLKTTKAWLPEYYHFDKAGAVNANFKDNIFNIETSRVGKISILISPDMVDLNKEVKVVINEKIAFAKKVTVDKAFILKQLKDNADRKAIWVNKLVLNVAN